MRRVGIFSPFMQQLSFAMDVRVWQDICMERHCVNGLVFVIVTNAPCLPAGQVICLLLAMYAQPCSVVTGLETGSLASGILDRKVSFGKTYFLLLHQP